MANSGSVGATGTDIFGQQTTQPQNPEQSLLNQLSTSTYPSTAPAELNLGLTNEQLGQVNPNLNNQLAYNNAMAGYQQANLGISNAQLGIQQTALGQQGQQQAAQQGFEQQGYNIQQGQYPEQQAEAALAYQNALQQTQGSQAIGGTQNTVGGKSAISTLGQQYGFQQQDIARSQALSQLGQQSEQSGYGYSQEQLQNAQQNLALNAQANGLSQQQLFTMLNYGNQQAGVQAQQQAQGLQTQQATDLISILAQGGPALSQIGFATNLNAIAGTG
jgi:hypothetical protein